MICFYFFTVCWTLSLVTDAIGDSLTSKHFILYSTKKTWNEARTICKNVGGRLAMVDNKATQEAFLAYRRRPNNRWSDFMNDDMWIGLNKDSDDEDFAFRWDHCEPVTDSSYTDWGENQPANIETSHCVAASKDDMRWRTGDCNNELEFLCEINNGSCGYTSVIGTCSSATYQNSSVSLLGCDDRCSTETYNELACWMYSFNGLVCTLYFDADPWKCSPPSQGFSFGAIRTCFTFAHVRTASAAPQTQLFPFIDCSLYTPGGQVLTTVDTTSDPKNVVVTSTVTPITDQPSNSISVMGTSDTAVTDDISTTMTHLATSMTQVPTELVSQPTAAPTTAKLTTDATTNISQTTTTSSTTERLQPVATTSLTSTSSHLTSTVVKSTSLTSTTTQPQSQTSHSTTATDPSATTITPTKTTTEVTTPATVSSSTGTHKVVQTTTGNPTPDNLCPCRVCFQVKRTTKRQYLLDALNALLKVDPTKLSASRRKKQSVPDERPSAQAIGWSGILFLAVCFSFVVIIDMARFCNFVLNLNSRRRK